jgi:chromosome segregation ATPase
LLKLNEEVATYEAKLAATRKELDERVSSNEEKNRNAATELDEAHKKFREAAAVHDSNMAELTKAHTLQMDSLRSELKSSQQDNESLKSQIARIYKDFEEKTVAADQASREQKAELAASQQKYREAVELHHTEGMQSRRKNFDVKSFRQTWKRTSYERDSPVSK